MSRIVRALRLRPYDSGLLYDYYYVDDVGARPATAREIEEDILLRRRITAIANVTPRIGQPLEPYEPTPSEVHGIR